MAFSQFSGFKGFRWKSRVILISFFFKFFSLAFWEKNVGPCFCLPSIRLVLVGPFSVEDYIFQFSKMCYFDNFQPFIFFFLYEMCIGLVIESSGIDLQIFLCCLLFVSLYLEVGRGRELLNFIFHAFILKTLIMIFLNFRSSFYLLSMSFSFSVSIILWMHYFSVSVRCVCMLFLIFIYV